MLAAALIVTTPTVNTLAADGFYTEGNPELSSISGNVVAISVENTNIAIDTVGASVFLEVTGTLDTGEIIDLTDYVDYTSNDTNIVFPYRSRILAKGVGETNVTISYEDLEISLDVSVQAPLVIPDNIPAPLASNVDISIASGMVFCTWMPRKVVKSWVDSNDKAYQEYYPGTNYTGVLYTQNDWNTKEEFLAGLSDDSFYVPLQRPNMSKEFTQPKYGNDCSGFLSRAWKLSSRHTTKSFKDGIANGTFEKVGGYNVEDAFTNDVTRTRLMEHLLRSYPFLQQGDSVVHRNNGDTKGHTFMIYINDSANKQVYAFEQTNPKAELTVWSYTDLATHLYLPFRKK